MTTNELPPPGSRAAIYKRISEDDEGLEAGVKRQDEDDRKLIARHGWTLDEVDVYCDNDISASTSSNKPRPDYDAMIAKAYARGVDVIVSYSNSRLTRRPLELEGLIVLHEKTSVAIVTCVSGPANLATADGRMYARIMVAVDAAEAERTRERTRRALQDRRDAGLPTAGGSRFGYLINNGGALRVNEGFRQLLKDVYVRWLAGDSFRALALEWNALGIRTTKGLQWTDRLLRDVMDTGFAAGLIREHSKESTNKNSNLESYDSWRVGVHEPIIDMGTWDQYKARRIANNHDHPKRAASKRALSGLLVCGVCHEHHPVKLAAAVNRGRKGWRCGRYTAHPYLWVMDDHAEAAVLDWLERNAIGGDDVDAREARIAQGRDAQSTVAKLESALAHELGRLLDLERAVLAKDISVEGGKLLRSEIEAGIAKIRADKVKAETRASKLSAPPPKAFTTLRQEWDNYSPAGRREALQQVLRYITVHPGRRKGDKPTFKFHEV